jgi:hypothetical protein
VVGEIPLYFYLPMERIFDGMEKENSKHKEERDKSEKIKKNKKERMEERKRTDFYVLGGSLTCVFSIGRGCPRAAALVQPSLRRTHSYGDLPYNLIKRN